MVHTYVVACACMHTCLTGEHVHVHVHVFDMHVPCSLHVIHIVALLKVKFDLLFQLQVFHLHRVRRYHSNTTNQICLKFS